ncbi:Kelch-type beta propeller, partial [Cynara cardunculus var. scolymus]
FEDIEGREISLDGLADELIFLVGGYNGISWLPSLDCYSAPQILTKALEPMNTERCYATASRLHGEIFVFGGGTIVANQWKTCPLLNWKNGGLAGATVNNKIYAIDGINGVE